MSDDSLRYKIILKSSGEIAYPFWPEETRILPDYQVSLEFECQNRELVDNLLVLAELVKINSSSRRTPLVCSLRRL